MLALSPAELVRIDATTQQELIAGVQELSQRSRRLAGTYVATFGAALCQSPNSKAEPGKTVYLGIRGEDKVFVAPKTEQDVLAQKRGTRMQEILDGTSNTIMVVQASDAEAVIWTKPDDLESDEQNPFEGLLGLHRGGFQALFCDGSVQFIAQSVDSETLKAMFTKAGGEVIRRP